MTLSRRRFERVPIRVPLLIIVDGELYRKKVEIECRNISGGGLSFETSREIPVEADLRIVLSKLGDLPDAAHIEGRVAYLNESSEAERYVVGVEFQRFINISQEELVDRIHSWTPPEPTGGSA